jgi:hypothetical protein
VPGERVAEAVGAKLVKQELDGKLAKVATLIKF